jgi:YidC/Oxa1 family membrane protein insertase
MSQSRPAPNPIVTLLLWAAIFFLGYQLLSNGCGNKAKNDGRTIEKVRESIVELNRDANDTALLAEAQVYDLKLQAEKDAGRLTAQQVEELRFEVDIIEIATAYANSLRNNDQGKLNNTYNNVFRGLREKHGKSPLWDRPVQIAPIEGKVADGSVTPEELYGLVVADLSRMNKTAKVLGYIPGYGMMDSLVKLTGANPGFSYWFAALLLAFIVRLAVFPLAQKQYLWGRRMSQLAPYIKEIQEKFKDKKTGQITDQQAMTLETMDLYKRYGFNPFAGCWPMLIQIPLFLIIYNCMLLYRFEFTKGYFLWIQPGAGTFLGIPLAPNLGERDYIIIFVYGVSMIVTTLLTPVSDPSNVKQQRLIGLSMAVLFSVVMFFWPLPSAFVVYWVFTNILATAQSLYVYRMPVEPLQPVQSKAGGAIPTTGRDSNGKTNVDPGFFGKTGKGSSKKKKKK